METVTKYYKAMLDTIAYTEGTLGVSQNGYDILFNNYTINGWRDNADFGHQGKDWIIASGGYSTSAAGRYQFLATSWFESSENNKTNLGLIKLTTPIIFDDRQYYYNAPFNKVNQDYLGYKLVSKKVSESSLTTASKSVNDFSKMIVDSKLDCTWTSLARALPVGTDVKSRCGYQQAEAGQVKNKQICQPNGCNSGAEEIYTVFKIALEKY